MLVALPLVVFSLMAGLASSVSLGEVIGLERSTPCEQTCPEDWIRVIWDVLTLKDGRTEVGAADVDRLFYAMDLNADDIVPLSEFGPFWRDCSLICERDVSTIFAIFARQSLPHDALITRAELFTAFNVDGGEMVTKVEFDRMWKEMLEVLPNKGCPTTTSPPVSCPAYLG